MRKKYTYIDQMGCAVLVTILGAVLLHKCAISQDSPLDRRVINRFCLNGPSDLRILGVGQDEEGKNALVTANSIAIYVDSIQGDSLASFPAKIPNPVFKPIEVKQQELPLGDKTMIFYPAEPYFMLKSGPLYFGGWNQVLFGCPQPLCLDSRLDAALVLESNLLVFRGKHFWLLELNSKTNYPAVENALKIEDYFPTLNEPVAAATVDSFGNIYFFDYHSKVHIYTKNLTNFHRSALPSSVSSRLGVETITRIFEVEPFQVRSLEPSGYSVLSPIDTKYFWTDTGGQFQPEAAFIVQVPEPEEEESMIVLGGPKVAGLLLPNALQTGVSKLLLSQDVNFGAEIFEEVKTFGASTKAVVGPQSVDTLHPNFPTNVHSAFTLSPYTFLNFGWKFYQVETRKFSLLSDSKLEKDSLSVVGNMMDSMLNCQEQDYENWGFESYKKFLNDYGGLLVPRGAVEVVSNYTSEKEEPTTIVSTVEDVQTTLTASVDETARTTMEAKKLTPSPTAYATENTSMTLHKSIFVKETSEMAGTVTTRTRRKSKSTKRKKTRTRRPKSKRPDKVGNGSNREDEEVDYDQRVKDKKDQIVPRARIFGTDGKNDGRNSGSGVLVALMLIGVLLALIVLFGAIITMVVVELKTRDREQLELSRIRSLESTSNIELHPTQSVSHIEEHETSQEALITATPEVNKSKEDIKAHIEN